MSNEQIFDERIKRLNATQQMLIIEAFQEEQKRWSDIVLKLNTELDDKVKEHSRYLDHLDTDPIWIKVWCYITKNPLPTYEKAWKANDEAKRIEDKIIRLYKERPDPDRYEMALIGNLFKK